MPEFEVAIYNQDVRERVAQGKRHRDLSDDWADIHYFDIEADDEVEARAVISRRYPERRGFVIEAIEQKKF